MRLLSCIHCFRDDCLWQKIGYHSVFSISESLRGKLSSVPNMNGEYGSGTPSLTLEPLCLQNGLLEWQRHCNNCVPGLLYIFICFSLLLVLNYFPDLSKTFPTLFKLRHQFQFSTFFMCHIPCYTCISHASNRLTWHLEYMMFEYHVVSFWEISVVQHHDMETNHFSLLVLTLNPTLSHRIRGFHM